MKDIFSGLGGIIKGIQPLMGEEAKNDESMQAFLTQTEVSDLQSERDGILAKIGQAVFEARRQDADRYSEFDSLCQEAGMIEQRIQEKQANAEAAQKKLEGKKRAEEKERLERTCTACGTENPPGTKFCSECGAKLGLKAAPVCPKCGTENAEGGKFCVECGAKLD